MPDEYGSNARFQQKSLKMNQSMSARRPGRPAKSWAQTNPIKNPSWANSISKWGYIPPYRPGVTLPVERPGPPQMTLPRINPIDSAPINSGGFTPLPGVITSPWGPIPPPRVESPGSSSPIKNPSPVELPGFRNIRPVAPEVPDRGSARPMNNYSSEELGNIYYLLSRGDLMGALEMLKNLRNSRKRK